MGGMEDDIKVLIITTDSCKVQAQHGHRKQARDVLSHYMSTGLHSPVTVFACLNCLKTNRNVINVFCIMLQTILCALLHNGFLFDQQLMLGFECKDYGCSKCTAVIFR